METLSLPSLHTINCKLYFIFWNSKGDFELTKYHALLIVSLLDVKCRLLDIKGYLFKNYKR